MDLNLSDSITIDEAPARRRRRRRNLDVEIENVIDVDAPKPPRFGAFAAVAIIVACVLLVLLTGCANTTIAQGEIINGEDYHVSNVHRLAPKLPERIRRVAILPVSAEPGSSDMASGIASLEPILQSEFDRLNIFEVVRVTPDQMRHFSGQYEWNATDKLPPNFLKTLKQETGCDAVMFCRLTRYHAYPPMAIGWNLKLADATDGQVWWAADEMFDLADRRVVNSARRFQLEHQKYYQSNPLLADSRTVLISPRRLAQYSAAALFATLPER